MSETIPVEPLAEESPRTTTRRAAERRRTAASFLSFQNIGAGYVLAGLVVVFAVWVPETFLSMVTFKQIFNSYAVTALAALSILIPLSARVFDLSFGYTMTLAGVVATQLVIEADLAVPLAVAAGVATGILVGVVNAVVVVVLNVDSFIGTLATGALLAAAVTMVTADIDITGVELTQGFHEVGQHLFLGFTLPVFYVVVVALVIHYVMQHTPFGRRIYATGFNADAARLAGIPTKRLRFAALMISGGLSGFAGVVLASTLGAGSVTAGTPYLLTAFAAAFLGATQFQRGRFNAAGTLLAVLLLGTGIVGLGLAEAPTWSNDLFTGTVLIVALVATQYQRRKRAGQQ